MIYCDFIAMKTLLSLACMALPLVAQEPVRYVVSFPNAAHHEAEVRATFAGVRQPVLEVLISRSSPGRYSLHEFPKNVYNLKATDGQGHALPISQPFDYQWNVSGHKGTVVVEYTVYGDRADGTFDGIDTTHAHLNMPATFAYAQGEAAANRQSGKWQRMYHFRAKAEVVLHAR
jgi:predicted metalloprotease with PDZ domain